MTIRKRAGKEKCVICGRVLLVERKYYEGKPLCVGHPTPQGGHCYHTASAAQAQFMEHGLGRSVVTYEPGGRAMLVREGKNSRGRNNA